jgi:DNA-binding transcriptional MerR regulator
LLQKPIRRENNYREYASTDLERLSFIRHCRALDISIADITELLEFVAQPTVDCHNVDNLIDSHLKRVRARLKSMRALEKQLLQLRDQCTGRLDGNCGIINELVAAAHQEANASAATKKPR